MEEQFFEPIIGLEVHIELKTKSKMFCGCRADYFGKPPNSLCCPTCLGLPGALPVPNKKAIQWCVMLGLALNCEIPEFSKFDRKNYFYPDLPKGYQISQYDKPFAINGSLKVKSQIQNPKSQINPKSEIQNLKRIRIRRVHMEEDTGKLLHSAEHTLIDFNRSGVPLVEVVTEPDIRSSEEARIFLKKLHQIIRYLGISDADMEKGSMRLEPNISVRKIGGDKDTSGVTRRGSPEVEELKLPPYKVEVKNINSFNFVKKAIDYEIQRQIEILKQGKTPIQETRGWDEKKGITYSQRTKEEAHDYRYFPEPDIPPIRWAKAQISNFKSQICELPEEKTARFIKDYGLSEYDAGILTETREIADYFEKCAKDTSGLSKASRHLGGGPERSRRDSPDGGGLKVAPKTIANWIINKRVDIGKTSPEELLSLISQKSQGSILSDEELEKAVKDVIIQNPKAVADYKSGKQEALMFLIGQVMRATKGKAEAGKIKAALTKLLS